MPYKIILFLLLFHFHKGHSEVQYSKLWGKEGELWSASSQLPDFSFAGYRSGETPIPDIPTTSKITDFGVVPNSGQDVTAAFKKAIAASQGGAIFIPEGHYLLSDILWIKKSNIVLRGAGPEKTILEFTKDLEDVRPNMGQTTSGKTTSNYSWSGGFIYGSRALLGKNSSQKSPVNKVAAASRLKLRSPQIYNWVNTSPLN
ncbi:hypothetical protein LNTAR_08954 [Lentisphaera araneosa HTCC2155]|uniref:Rhamnogalacturonase A/B/Epimerase-like pectate lyase domain-containing protein n=1 Tax=Lentisphaera araneosa HTCC2155 TaxID=313628 RepID=A6DI32_9BACT|nr:glycosyl hydrolase family 28-related protein [Lentisphaera araneosa]EDM28686.1 hypothetical protein LNTAR_08954 [Lentisphaera araneosa HTCC2155]